MPKRSYRKKYRKRKGQDINMKGDKEVIKTGQTRSSVVVYRGIGLPEVFYTKLKHNLQLSYASFPFDDRAFAVNDLHNRQPQFWDQLIAIYKRYALIASEVSVMFVNKTANGEASYQKVGMYPHNLSTLCTSNKEAIERDNCIYAQLGPNTGDQGIINMTGYAKVHKMLGMPADEKLDDTLTSNTNTSPTRLAYWHIWAGTNDGTTLTNCYVDITFTYYVRFSSRQAVTVS